MMWRKRWVFYVLLLVAIIAFAASMTFAFALNGNHSDSTPKCTPYHLEIELSTD